MKVKFQGKLQKMIRFFTSSYITLVVSFKPIAGPRHQMLYPNPQGLGVASHDLWA
jgi:hypothetical protein